MPAELNRWTALANLAADPEMRYTSGGSALCKLRLAVNHTYYVNQEKREETCYIDGEAWGKMGEACNEHLRKGSPILIEGRLKMESWEDRDSGRQRHRHVVVAERVQFLGASTGERRQADPGGRGGGRRPAQQQRQRQTAEPPQEQGPSNVDDNSVDNIPF